MKFESPIDSNYMKDIRLEELILEAREGRLCDAKNEIGRYNMLQELLIDELMQEETKDLLKEKRKLKSLQNVYRNLSIQN